VHLIDPGLRKLFKKKLARSARALGGKEKGRPEAASSRLSLVLIF
jgi:hypothetical protein